MLSLFMEKIFLMNRLIVENLIIISPQYINLCCNTKIITIDKARIQNI